MRIGPVGRPVGEPVFGSRVISNNGDEYRIPGDRTWRVRGLAMPHVELVDMKVVNRHRRGIHLLSERLEHLLRVTLEAKHQAILLLNRRGYSNFVYCVSCQNVIQCKYCDTTMTYHRSAGARASLAPGRSTQEEQWRSRSASST